MCCSSKGPEIQQVLGEWQILSSLCPLPMPASWHGSDGQAGTVPSALLRLTDLPLSQAIITPHFTDGKTEAQRS